ATEGHDPRLRAIAGEARHDVSVQSRTHDQAVDRNGPVIRSDPDTVAFRHDPGDLVVEYHLPTRSDDVVSERPGDPGEIGDRRARRMQRGEPGGVRLDLAD